jgi:YtkA-like
VISGPEVPHPMKALYGFWIILVLVGGASAAENRCRVDDGPCTAAAGEVSVSLEIEPRPVRAMKLLTFAVILRDSSRKLEDASVSIDLTMPGMEMGRNVIELKHAGGGRYEGKGVIVRCPSGGRTWKAAITVVRRSGAATADFLFEVH